MDSNRLLYLLWLGKMAKVIIYFSFFFLFFSGLTTQEWSIRKYHITKCHRVTGLWVIVRWHHMTKSYRNHRKIVHRLCSSCISSVGNSTGTPLSFPCQLRLGVVLRYLSLSSYNTGRVIYLYLILGSYNYGFSKLSMTTYWQVTGDKPKLSNWSNKTTSSLNWRDLLQTISALVIYAQETKLTTTNLLAHSNNSWFPWDLGSPYVMRWLPRRKLFLVYSSTW